jgi:hypothetical protein
MLHSLQSRTHKRLYQLLRVAGLLYFGTSIILGKAAHATVEETLLLLTEPLNVPEVVQYRSGTVPADQSVVTEATISQTGLTLPSLWWAKEQFGNKLLDYWVAYRGTDGIPRRIDLMVNQQVWVQYNYLERYAFVSHFGTAASDFGYSTRIFNWQGDLLAAYICEFVLLPQTHTPPNLWSASSPNPAPQCQVFLDSTGTGALSGASQFGAPLSTNGETD